MTRRSHKLLLPVAATLLAGCVEKKVVRSTELLAGLPGAEGGSAPVRPGVAQGSDWEALLEVFDDPDEQGANWAPVEGMHLREESEDGEIRLISLTPGQVMFHLTQTLQNDEYELLFEQVLSEHTKAAYAARGRDPMDAVAFLARHQSDIADLFAALPLGEQTPGVLLENIGPNAFRLSAPPALAPDLRFTRFDVIIEQGSFRLLMIR